MQKNLLFHVWLEFPARSTFAKLNIQGCLKPSSSSCQDSAVHPHLKDKGHSFDNSNIHILDREDRWFEREVKEAIYLKLERPPLNSGGSLRHHLSSTYSAVLRSIPMKVRACLYNALTGVYIGFRVFK